MSSEFESPFLDRGTPPSHAGEGSAGSPGEFEAPFDESLVDPESPFPDAEGLEPYDVAAEYDASPELFDSAEQEGMESMESADEQWLNEMPDEREAYESEWPTSSAESGLEESEGHEESEGTREFVLMEDEGEGVDETGEGESVLMSEGESEWAEEQESSAGSRVRARILWPALGFPAVIAPRDDARGAPTMDSSATRCVTVLLLSDRKALSKEEAARYLRIVPWSQRGRRHIPAGQPGSFAETDLVVRNDEVGPRLVIPQPKGASDQLIVFGGDKDEGRMVVNLAKHVRDLYGGYGLKFLHEIRIGEAASARLADGTYHLFWNNESPKEDTPSDEMALLLERFAKPRRKSEGAMWQKVMLPMMREYEYEYGTQHLPYLKEKRPLRRAEVLHPVFVRKRPSPVLRVGHITDLHVDVRADVYEENLSKAGAKLSFNNWNTSVAQVYAHAQQDADVLLLTGDLIDYGRAHFGISARTRLGDNNYYHRDRNWFLLYDLLAAGDRYKLPVYTSLGNHDWRLNPYPPFAIAGAPSPRLLVHDYDCFSKDELKGFLRTAHGPGHEAKFSYDLRSVHDLGLAGIVQNLARLVRQTKTMNHKGLPTETTIDSVIWYLLSMNPFFDYMWVMPTRHRLLMLDWAKDEDVLFPKVSQGKDGYPYLPWEAGAASDDGPKAKRCLTPSQRWLVQQFVESPGSAKIIGIHAPPIGPYTDWGDDDLAKGVKTYKSLKEARGPTNYGIKADGKTTPIMGHPLFAIRPKGGAAGMDAQYNSFVEGREWFIETLAHPKSGVRMVLSGHIHRNGLYVVRVPGAAEGAAVSGRYLLRSAQPMDSRGVKAPEISHLKIGARAPLYVNTTSAGPRGNHYPTVGQHINVPPGYAHVELSADGTIHLVSFRQPVTPSPLSCNVEEKRRKALAGQAR